jgi:hypothetical protein
VHQSGYPHVNVTISNRQIHAAAGREKDKNNPSWLSAAAEECGFGWKCHASPMRDGPGMAGYLTKLGLELAGAARKNQVPVNAPRHFRRIRASRGLLPQRFKDPDITGQLFKQRYDLLNDQINGKRS